jgi:DNA-directed RNA polymerase specialized sigma subunit
MIDTLTRQQEDLALWKQWKSSNDRLALQKLMTRLEPLIQSEVGKWGQAVPRQALEAKAKLLTVEALETYDPNKGAAIGTHVASRLRKLSRSVYPYQNVARVPENQQLYFHTFNVASGKLQDELGRDPSVDEMADELGWSQKRVTHFQNAFARRELVESEGAFWEGDRDEGIVDFYHHGLAPRDKQIFEDIIGYNGKTPMKNPELMKKYAMTQAQLSYLKRKYAQDLQRFQTGGR